MLREIPPVHQLEISRDGNIQTMAVQLVDRKAMEHEVWSKLNVEPGPVEPAPPGGWASWAVTRPRRQWSAYVALDKHAQRWCDD